MSVLRFTTVPHAQKPKTCTWHRSVILSLLSRLAASIALNPSIETSGNNLFCYLLEAILKALYT